MKQTTQDVEAIHLHTRSNGVQVYVTTEHLRRINKRRYRRGLLPPNYPMPAIRFGVGYDVVQKRVVVFRHYTDDDYELPEIVAKF